MYMNKFIEALLRPISWFMEGTRPIVNILTKLTSWFFILSFVGGIVVIIVIYIMSIVQSLDRRKNPPRGKYFKESPLDTIVLTHKYSFLEPCNDWFTHHKHRKKYESCGFEIRYEAKKTTTKWILESDEARMQNRKRIVELEKELARRLTEESPCLLDYRGYVLRYGGKEKTLDLSENLECTFALDKKKDIELWLKSQTEVKNSEGFTVAVRGIDENTIDMLLSLRGEKDFEISSLIIPLVDENEISEMTLSELMRFRKKENCKFRISNENEDGRRCFFEYSDVRGYTKEDITEIVRSLAESKGYKFKIAEKKFIKKLELILTGNSPLYMIGTQWISRKEDDK